MNYAGRYRLFDSSRIKTYPVRTRRNKVRLSDLVAPKDAIDADMALNSEVARSIETLAQAMVNAREQDRPVILFTGAHLVKNGLSPLIIDLVERGMISLVATNGAGAIHDFELALIGETSEDVPNALPEGRFGMACEFRYINEALKIGHENGLGYGESLGRMIREPELFETVRKNADCENGCMEFRHPDQSLLAQCDRLGIPFTVHASIGTDVTDQHAGFSAEAKGACSGRDFLMFVQEIARMHERGGGIALNVGSAVTGPEVLLKAVSMAANAGEPPWNLSTADFDLRPYQPSAMRDEESPYYYFRDHKSVATRIPSSFEGRGLYIEGNQKSTIPYLYKTLVQRLDRKA